MMGAVSGGAFETVKAILNYNYQSVEEGPQYNVKESGRNCLSNMLRY